MHALLLPAVLLLAVTVQTAQPAKPRVYLGPLPDAAGFTAPIPKDLADSYRDLRKQYAERAELRAAFELAATLPEADVVLTITFRGERATGNATAATSVYRGTAVTTQRVETKLQLTATLTVPGTETTIPLDGTQGLTLITYSRQARNLLKQTADWLQANAAALAAVKAPK